MLTFQESVAKLGIAAPHVANFANNGTLRPTIAADGSVSFDFDDVAALRNCVRECCPKGYDHAADFQAVTFEMYWRRQKTAA